MVKINTNCKYERNKSSYFFFSRCTNRDVFVASLATVFVFNLVLMRVNNILITEETS